MALVKALANLSLRSQRLSLEFEKTVTQLRELQKERQELNDLQRSRTGPRPVRIGTCIEK
jgi:hypothetical protein